MRPLNKYFFAVFKDNANRIVFLPLRRKTFKNSSYSNYSFHIR